MFFPVIEQGLGSYAFNLSTANPKTFVRLRLTTVPMINPETFDLDGDGWGNLFELETLATSPFLKDTDEDGNDDGSESVDGDPYPDAWELLYFGDLTTLGVADANGDWDGDGISNAFEAQMRTDPNSDQSATYSSREGYTYTAIGQLDTVSGDELRAFVFDDEGNLESAE